jgi:hypothetical protein
VEVNVKTGERKKHFVTKYQGLSSEGKQSRSHTTTDRSLGFTNDIKLQLKLM